MSALDTTTCADCGGTVTASWPTVTIDRDGLSLPDWMASPERPCRKVCIGCREQIVKGRVVDTYERDVRVMSDVWELFTFATIAVERTNGVEFHEQQWDRGSWHRGGISTHDTDARIMGLYQAWREGRNAGLRRLGDERYAERHEQRTPDRGDWIRVARGRKVAKGLVGYVFWTGESNYGTRLGVDCGTGSPVWVDARNCDVMPVETLFNDAGVTLVRFRRDGRFGISVRGKGRNNPAGNAVQIDRDMGRIGGMLAVANDAVIEGRGADVDRLLAQVRAEIVRAP